MNSLYMLIEKFYDPFHLYTLIFDFVSESTNIYKFVLNNLSLLFNYFYLALKKIIFSLQLFYWKTKRSFTFNENLTFVTKRTIITDYFLKENALPKRRIE